MAAKTKAKKTQTRKKPATVPKKRKRSTTLLHARFGRNKNTIPPRKKSRIVVKTPVEWHIRVARYNPSIDFLPRTHEYSVSPREGESVLDLLTRIKQAQDGSLTFRSSCGYGGCGTCGIRVNGKPVLGCVTQVKDHLDKDNGLRVDPLENERIIKDLVVDEKPFFDQLRTVKPFIVPRPTDARRNHKMGIHDVTALGKTPLCMLCGLCNANADASMKPELGPAAFVKGYRYANEMRDGDSTRVHALAARLPVHYSLEKANLCPRDIAPGDRIKEIQAKADKSHPRSTSTKRKP